MSIILGWCSNWYGAYITFDIGAVVGIIIIGVFVYLDAITRESTQARMKYEQQLQQTKSMEDGGIYLYYTYCIYTNILNISSYIK